MVVMYVIHTSSFLHKNHHMSSGVAQDIWPCGTKELTTELSLEGDNSLINENQDTQPDNDTLNWYSKKSFLKDAAAQVHRESISWPHEKQ